MNEVKINDGVKMTVLRWKPLARSTSQKLIGVGIACSTFIILFPRFQRQCQRVGQLQVDAAALRLSQWNEGHCRVLASQRRQLGGEGDKRSDASDESDREFATRSRSVAHRTGRQNEGREPERSVTVAWIKTNQLLRVASLHFSGAWQI